MTYKTILVHIDHNARANERIRIAIELAKQNEAHLIGLAVSASLVTPYLGAMDPMGGYAAGLIETHERLARVAASDFEAQALAAGLHSYESRVDGSDAVTAVRRQARYTDLVIVGQTDKSTVSISSPSNLPQATVLEAGKPVLIIPYVGVYTALAQNIFVLWNASREAARAAGDALPFLKLAKNVRVSVFDAKSGTPTSEQVPGSEAAHYLARHGVNVTITRDSSDGDVGSAVLSRVADHHADLIVMGGYGHSRFREWVLGGVSQSILEHMTVPVLMSH